MGIAKQVDMYPKELEPILKDNKLMPEEQYKMYSQLFSEYSTFEHENAHPATVILKQNTTDDENDSINLKVKEKDWLNDEKLLREIPKQFKDSVSLLLEYVRRNASININQQGEILIEGN
uniref:Uncharacterized protein n=1 Tax=Romanomermis culicivorax TaxID=13658 RepID=A0A915IDD6_ROMCU